VIVPASLLYAFAEVHVTQQRVKVALVVLFAIGLAAVIRFLARMGGVRDQSFAAFVGFVLGILAVYFAWMWFLLILGGWNPRDLMQDPATIWRRIVVLAQNGIWQNRRGPVGPQELTLWWAGETAIILVCSAWGATLNSEPFCERCNRWTIASPTLALPFAARAPLIRALEDEQYDELLRLEQRPEIPDREITAVVFSCPDCDDTHYLTLKAVRYSSAKKESKAETAPILEQLSIPAVVAKWIRERAALEMQEQAGSHDAKADATELEPT
jgi:hypothetical protein